MCKRLLVLALVAMLSPAVLGKIIVDDHFDDGVIGTNTKGTGSGFNSWDIEWSATVTEANSIVTLNGPVHGGSRCSITSKDGAAIGSGISRFEFQDVSFAVGNTNPGTCARDCVGVKGDNKAWDYNTLSRAPTGFWIAPENTALSLPGDPGSAGGWNGTSVLFYVSSTGAKTVLATWTFDTLNWYPGYPGALNLAPVLDLTLDISSTSYSLTIAGDTITLLSGAISGAFAANELVTGYASAYIQSENPGIDILIDRIVITENVSGSESASRPSPADGEEDVAFDTELTWSPGIYAGKHNVYMGRSFDDVNDATATSPLLVSKGQTATTYPPDVVLDFEETWYWRVDEVNAAPDNTVFKGEVWSFTVEPYSYPLPGTAMTATTSGNSFNTSGTNTINRSGLNPDDTHSVDRAKMWVSDATQPAWIEYAFDRLYRLDKMKVWNSNTAFESFVGYGFKDVSIDYFDGETWNPLTETQFDRAPGRADYAGNEPLDLGYIAAKSIRLTAQSTWGGKPSSSLSEVRFYYVPTYAWTQDPNGAYLPTEAWASDPVDGTTEVDPDVVLTWRTGREAQTHELYLGTDADDLPLVDTVTGSPYATYDTSALDLQLSQTYYWRINEVNEAQVPSIIWEGDDVQSFTVADFVVVDDFESYTNDAESYSRVFQTWIDGAGYTNPVDFPGNGTGSYMGYDPAVRDIMETSIFHGGSQSAPFSYGNNGKSTSEVRRTFAEAQDWTGHGITTLVVYFYGNPENGPGQLYVKINNTRVNYSGPADALLRGRWTQWPIDLTDTSTVPTSVLKNVTSLTLGMEGAGSQGLLLVDDILLY